MSCAGKFLLDQQSLGKSSWWIKMYTLFPDLILVGQICSASAGRQEDFTSHRVVQKSKPFPGGRQIADGTGQGRD